jgi:hypothetical protein
MTSPATVLGSVPSEHAAVISPEALEFVAEL